MKSILTALILVLMVTVCAIAVENPLSIRDEMIIDRSTRVKPLNDYALTDQRRDTAFVENSAGSLCAWRS